MRSFGLDGSGFFSEWLNFGLCRFSSLLGCYLPSNSGLLLLCPSAPPVHHGARVLANPLDELRIPTSMMKSARKIRDGEGREGREGRGTHLPMLPYDGSCQKPKMHNKCVYSKIF